MGRGTYATKPWAQDALMRNLGVFAEGNWTLAAGQHVIAGARMDRADVVDQRSTCLLYTSRCV